jgi:DNA processing protein
MLHLKFHALEAVSRNYAPSLSSLQSEFPLYSANTLAVLLWAHIPKMGLKRQKQLFQSFGDDLLWQLFWVPPHWAFEHFSESFSSFPPTLLKAWEEKQHYFKTHLTSVLTHYQTHEVGWMGCHDARFPQRLAQIHESPSALFYKGNVELLKEERTALSVVGTRHASEYACEQVQRILEEVAVHPLCIVSGLAMGIDAVAHQAALDYKLPTLAVLAGGLDYITPTCNEPLAASILEQDGLLLSEMPLGVPPIPKSFPRRNRLIVGLSPALWVVEGNLQSGTMISARIALEESRDVAVLPMDITRPGAAGPLKLLKEGAMPITSGQDLADLLGMVTGVKIASTLVTVTEPPKSSARPKSPSASADPVDAVDLEETPDRASASPQASEGSDSPVLAVLSQSSTKALHIDSLVLLSGLKATEVLTELSLLELQGLVERQSGNLFKLA